MLIIFCHICAKVNFGSMVGWQKLPVVDPHVHGQVHALVPRTFVTLATISCWMDSSLLLNFKFWDACMWTVEILLRQTVDICLVIRVGSGAEFNSSWTRAYWLVTFIIFFITISQIILSGKTCLKKQKTKHNLTKKKPQTTECHLTQSSADSVSAGIPFDCQIGEIGAPKT